MRVTLVKPPERSELNFGTFSLAVLAAAVKDIAEITIIDATTFSLEQTLEEISKSTPDLIGITAMGTASINPVLSVLKRLKESQIKARLVVGGQGATMLPRPLLEAGADAIVCGEGEITFQEVILKGISDQIPGLTLLRNGTLFKSPSRPLIQLLDSLKEPIREFTNLTSNNIALLETSRGCPYNCAFCASSRFYHGVWRARSPEKVAQDVKSLVKNQTTIIHIVDDNFTANPKRALEICHLLQNGPLPLLFFFSGRSDDLLKIPELIPALAKARFLRICMGIETLLPELAAHINKPIPFFQHAQAIQKLQKAGVFTMGSFIIGLPNETAEMRSQVVELAVKVGVDMAQFVPFQPLPGTPFEKGNGEPEPWAVQEAARATSEFRRHPRVIKRLSKSSQQNTVFGLLSRLILVKILNENTLDSQIANSIRKKLTKSNLDSIQKDNLY
jgi:anaerobic magnesium-protoporphyrin IX monomethyl ester cyclase